MSDVEVTEETEGEDEGVYVGVDPDYQNSAYPVTDPGPMDEIKELTLENQENCAVADPGEWTEYYHNKETSTVVTDEAPAEEGEEGLDEEEDLDAMTLTELRARAAELNISGRSSMDHDELVDAIAAAEA